MHCSDCNKFAALETQDPEVDNLEVSHSYDAENKTHTYTVTAQVRLVRVCAEDGCELKETTFELEKEVNIFDDDMPKECFNAPEGEDRLNPADAEVQEQNVEATESGGGRYAKSYFGVTVGFSIELNGKTIHEDFFEDKCAASEMDELV